MSIKKKLKHDSKKNEISQTVNTKDLASYNKIIQGKSGVALSKIEGESCGVCQMRLMSQTINEVMMGNKIILCESCSRILYIDPSA